MVEHHPKAHSWMEDDHKNSKREGGQIPYVFLIGSSQINCRGAMTSTGGGCENLSPPWIILHLGHAIHHSAPALCLFSLLGDLALVLLEFFDLILKILRSLGYIMTRERGKPRWGPSWYCYVAGQRRQHNLERDLSIAQTYLIMKPMTPPMVVMEEEILEEPI
jgi:hypothetical protein